MEIPGGGTVALTARHAVVICTGSRTALPELAGLAEARPWTNREATDSHGSAPPRPQPLLTTNSPRNRPYK